MRTTVEFFLAFTDRKSVLYQIILSILRNLHFMHVYEKELRSRPPSRFEIALKPEITDTGTDNTRFEKKIAEWKTSLLNTRNSIALGK